MNAKQVFSNLSLMLSLFAATGVFARDVPPQKSTPAALVDALNGVFGKQTDNRAVHAKGIVPRANSRRAHRQQASARHRTSSRRRYPSPSASQILPAYQRSPTQTRMRAGVAWR